MKGYSLPPQLEPAINDLEELIGKFRKGEIHATELKAHRVPFGVYEQREPDTYMVRIRCAAGIISPLQLEKVAGIAAQYGSGDIHITTRQELQIHSVRLDDVIAIIRQLKKSGLTTRGGGGNTVRNITAQEDAGIDPDEEFDVTPYAVALTTRFIAEDDSWNLPRKFKIAFSGSAKDKGYATLTDAGFIAARKDGRNGFRVYAAGGLGAKPEAGNLLLDFIPADKVYPAARVLKTIFWKYGNRKNRHAARLRFLWSSLGEEEFKRRFREEYSKVEEEGFSPLAIDEEGAIAVTPGLAEEEPRDKRNFDLWKERFVKEQKQKGLFSAEIAIELGFISHERAVKLAKFIAHFGDDMLRMTKNQNFLLRNIPGRCLGNFYNFLDDTFQDLNRPAIYGRILSCAGASTCQIGICLSRQAAKALMNLLENSGMDLDRLGDIKLNISGCPNSCGQHPAADLGFFGKALRKEGSLYPAYNVVSGAVIGDGMTRLAEQAGEIPAKALPKMVADIFAGYLSGAAKYKSIREYMQTGAKEALKEICARYKDIPDFDEDKNYYFDWGSQDPFSLAERRGGECSAGIFDLIEMDLKNIKDTRVKLENAGEDKEKKAGLIDRLIFYSARMLLVTRGVEPKSEEEAYKAFLQHFVETGLIAASFKDIIEMAGRKDRLALFEKDREARELAEAVESLYENMDNSFNFKPRPAEHGEAVAGPVIAKDLRGVACPMNFVKTKAELSKLKSGDKLEIWLDDGPPIENVPGSVKAEGHKIVAQKRTGNYWSVVIEKK